MSLLRNAPPRIFTVGKQTALSAGYGKHVRSEAPGNFSVFSSFYYVSRKISAAATTRTGYCRINDSRDSADSGSESNLVSGNNGSQRLGEDDRFAGGVGPLELV